MKRIMLAIVVAAMTYIVGVAIVLAIFGQSISDYLRRVEFWAFIIIVVILAAIWNRFPKHTPVYIGKLVSMLLLAMGITLIFLANNMSLWHDPPWEPSVFGAGVSVTAIGMMLLTIFWSRSTKDTETTILSEHENQGTSSFKPTGVSMAKRLFRRHPELIFGLLATSILLVILIMFQTFLPSVLALDWKWIVVSAIPLLLALLIGGYIRVFKGFGIELEMRLEEPVSSMDLRATDALTSLTGIAKQRIADLERMSEDQKRKVGRLRFYASRRDYYDASVTLQYMRQLPNLEYFEIIRSNGAFMFFLPVSIFKIFGDISIDELGRFVDAMQEGRVLSVYRQEVIDTSVPADQSIVDVLEIVRRQGAETVAVTDDKGAAIGVIKSVDIERRIAAEVLLEARIKKRK